MTATVEPTGDTQVAVNTSTALRWRGLVAVVLFGGGGLVLLTITVFGLLDQHTGQRIGEIALSVVLLAFGGFALRGVLRPSVWVVVGGEGLTLRGRPGGFEVGWAELSTLVLDRERRSWGRSRYWFYRLLLIPRAVDEFVVRHPGMAARRGRDHYVYDLGRIGRAGRKLDRALRLYAPGIFDGVRTR